MWKVYVLYNKTIDRYYIGSTNDIERRLKEHNSKRREKRYTEKMKGEWEVLYIENYKNIGEARKRKRYVKKQKSRKYIDNLIMKSAGSSMDRATAF